MSARISLDQWQALIAVVEADGYAPAAERLNKSQSTISYAIGRIEHLLDVQVFQIQGRKARLTPVGQLLYRRGQALVAQAERMEQAAARFARGWETELRLAIEIIFPTWKLLECLRRLADEQPELAVQLHESVLGGTEELLLSGAVDLAVCSSIPQGFLGDPLTPVRFVAAAAPCHPLHRVEWPLTADDLRRHRHLLVRDSGSRRVRAPAWTGAETRWTVSHKATSIRAACMGLGFAWYPEDNIRPELESGTLKPLPLAEGGVRTAQLYLVFADRDSAGPAACRMAELLRAAVAGETV